MDIHTELRLARERIEQLKARNEYLQEQILDERERLAPVKCFPVGWGFTPKETKMLAALLSRETLTRDQLMAAMYLPHERDEIEPKIVEVFMCKVRAKLRPLGATIHTRFGVGWSMDPADRKRLCEQLKEAA
jgi:DNA-binding response OmpR family regulator